MLALDWADKNRTESRGGVRQKAIVGFVTLVAAVVVMSPLVAKADATTRYVCSTCTYSTIQGAINAATPGDVVSVGPGTYAENVTIAKSITLVGSGDGIDPTESTIIDPSVNGAAITINGATGVSISALRVTGATGGGNTGSGILTTGTAVANVDISDVTSIANAGYGIAFNIASSNVTLTDTDSIGNSEVGIRVASNVTSVGLTVIRGVVSGNGGAGFSYNPSGSDRRAYSNTISFTSTQFDSNATTPGGSVHDFSMIGFNGDLTLKDVDIATANPVGKLHLGYAVVIRGYRASGADTAAGKITFDGVTVHGPVGKGGVYLAWYNNMDNVSFSNVDVSGAVAPWGQLISENTVTKPLNLGTTTLSTLVEWSTGPIDATSVTFKNMSSGVTLDDANLADNFAIEDQVVHAMDVSSLGLVRWKSSNLYVTPSSFLSPYTSVASLQRAYGLVAPGDTLSVKSGTYAEASISEEGTASVTSTLTLDSDVATGSVDVASGGTLKGNGTISGSLNIDSGGSLAPGNSPGVITVTGDYVQAGALNIDVIGTSSAPIPGTDVDQVVVNGDVTLSTGSSLSVSFFGSAPAAATEYVIVKNDGSNVVSGIFADLAEGSSLTSNGQVFIISYVGGDGNDISLTAQLDQSSVTVVATSPAVYGSSQTLTTTGGNGTGSISYSVGSSTACSVSGAVLTITSGTGTCLVTATKAASPGYLVATSSVVSITVEKAAVTVTSQNVTVAYGAAVPAFTPVVTGFIREDGWVATPVCQTSPEYSTMTPVSASGATIVCGSGNLGTLGDSNYLVEYVNSGVLTINSRSITVTAPSVMITYGDSVPALAPTTYVGYLNGDTYVTAPTCSTTYAGDPVGAYPITCSGGDAGANYTFSFISGTLTVTPYLLGPTDAVYTGQQYFYTKSSSDTAVQVTLTASISADIRCNLGVSVSDARATFRDVYSGKVFAKDVAIAEVGGNCQEGIATAIATLSTGGSAELYQIVIEVNGSLANAGQPLEQTSVTVATPSTSGSMSASGEIGYIAQTSISALGTEGSLTNYVDASNPVTIALGFTASTKKTPAKGQVLLSIPGPGGSTYYIKSNSITSLVASSTDATIFTKASIWQLSPCPTGFCSTSIDGGASLQVKLFEPGSVAVTVQSAKTSVLYYSNNWVKSGKSWATQLQPLSPGLVSVG